MTYYVFIPDIRNSEIVTYSELEMSSSYFVTYLFNRLWIINV